LFVDKLKRIGRINTNEDEAIRSLFYNKVSDSMITVSIFITVTTPTTTP